MCGRFTLKTPVIDWLMSLFPNAEDSLRSLARSLTDVFPTLATPRYNIAPTQSVWVITQSQSDPQGNCVVDATTVRSMRWGLVPAWADAPNVAYSMINARSETLQEKPTFKKLIPEHRCIVVADGYYEWMKPAEDAPPKSPKQPYWIHRPSEMPFAMAGLWTENHRVQPGQSLLSTTIITTEANEDTAPVHDRMPVVLDHPQAIQQWLNLDTEPDRVLELLHPGPKGFFIPVPVSNRVNSPKHDSAELIQPFDAP